MVTKWGEGEKFMVTIFINPKSSFILVSNPDITKFSFNHSTETFLMLSIC